MQVICFRRSFPAPSPTGHLILVPSLTSITIRLLNHPSGTWPEELLLLEGRRLHLPQKKSSRVPYMRVLAYFALVAKDRHVVGAHLERELIAGCSASDSDEGNAMVMQMSRNLERTGRLRFDHVAVAAGDTGRAPTVSRGGAAVRPVSKGYSAGGGASSVTADTLAAQLPAVSAKRVVATPSRAPSEVVGASRAIWRQCRNLRCHNCAAQQCAKGCCAACCAGSSGTCASHGTGM